VIDIFGSQSCPRAAPPMRERVFHTRGVLTRVRRSGSLLRIEPVDEVDEDVNSESDSDPSLDEDMVFMSFSLKLGRAARRGRRLRERGVVSFWWEVGGARPEPSMSRVVVGGVMGSSPSAIGKVIGGSSSLGVVSRLGGGELNPDLGSGESPLRRFVAR
jgi:hypothetical protein